jgi:hypothetical protein
MTPDAYVLSVIRRYAAPVRPLPIFLPIVAKQITPHIRKWAGEYFSGLTFSGSYAKGTAIRGVTDFDLFISLKPNTPGSLKDIYYALYDFADAKGWIPRVQNVSIGIALAEQKIDLVPARRQASLTAYHSLYRSKADSWTQTNVAIHIKRIRESQRRNEIRALKIWRLLHGLDFPSFYLELTVMDALRGRRGSLAANVLHTLAHIATKLPLARIVDPSNTNNIISEDLTADEKRVIAAQAEISCQQPYWKNILW